MRQPYASRHACSRTDAGRFIDLSLRRCAGERIILRNMKPTLIALLAL